MQKKDWRIVFGVLILSALLIPLSRWIVSLSLGGSGSIMLGPVGFMITESAHSFDITEYKKILTSSIFSGFFLFLFFVLNLILVQKLLGLRLSLVLFIVGILSDSLDSVLYGSTLDWLTIYGRHFNLADLYILAGVASMIYFCIRDQSIIFKRNSLRKKMFIDKDQYIFCVLILCSYFVFIIGMGLFFLIFTKMILVHFMQVPQNIQSHLLVVGLLFFSLLAICFLIIIFGFVVYISNKIYGPVYAFKKYVREVFVSGEADRPFKLRKGDHFNDLQDLAGQLKGKYGKNQ